jgi:hypothetical protein
MNNISEISIYYLPLEIKLEILTLLDEDSLRQMRAVSKEYQIAIDARYQSRLFIECPRKSQLKNEYRKISLLKSQIKEKKDQLNERTLTRKGFFISRLRLKNNTTQKISKFLESYSWAKKEIEEQNKIQSTIDSLWEQVPFIDFKSKISPEKQLECNLREINNKIKKLNIAYRPLIAFFGIKKFNEIPFLEPITRERLKGDYIDFIQPTEMTSSIMRGVDCFNRPFLSFKTTLENSSQPNRIVVQTLFKRYTDKDTTWTSGGYPILPIYEHFFIEKGQFPSKIHKLLSDFFEKIKVQNFVR